MSGETSNPASQASGQQQVLPVRSYGRILSSYPKQTDQSTTSSVSEKGDQLTEGNADFRRCSSFDKLWYAGGSRRYNMFSDITEDALESMSLPLSPSSSVSDLSHIESLSICGEAPQQAERPPNQSIARLSKIEVGRPPGQDWRVWKWLTTSMAQGDQGLMTKAPLNPASGDSPPSAPPLPVSSFGAAAMGPKDQQKTTGGQKPNSSFFSPQRDLNTISPSNW